MYSTSQINSLDDKGLQANPAEPLLANAAFHASSTYNFIWKLWVYNDVGEAWIYPGPQPARP